MNSKYFRRRKPFDFDPHPLDVGVPFSKNDTHADVHFLIKVQRLPESQLEDLFLRHFNYYKAEFNDTDGREFFKELWQTVNSEKSCRRHRKEETTLEYRNSSISSRISFPNMTDGISR